MSKKKNKKPEEKLWVIWRDDEGLGEESVPFHSTENIAMTVLQAEAIDHDNTSVTLYELVPVARAKAEMKIEKL